MKEVTKVAALGGGIYYTMNGSGASAAIADKAIPQVWSSFWRPASPKRLSALTHDLAGRAIAGEHGREMTYATFKAPDRELIGMPADKRYSKACRLVAEQAPLRILPGERIVGSATLKEAAAHAAPVANVSSTSHTTLGFDRVMNEGYNGLRARIQDRLAQGGLGEAVEAPAPVTVPGRFDGAVAFRPVAGGVISEALSAPGCVEFPITVECWTKLNSKTGFNVLALNHNKTSPFHWEIYSYPKTGGLGVYIPGFKPYEVNSDHDIADGQWHYVAMQLSRESVRLFVDGAMVKEQAMEGAPASGPSEGSFYLAGYPEGPIICDGAVQEVRVSKGVRDCSQVPQALMAPEAATICLWRASATPAKMTFEDMTGAGNHALPTTPAATGADFLEAMLECLDAAEIWRQRHIALLDERIAASAGPERANYEMVRATLERVPNESPRTFREAVQSLWFMYSFQRLMGTWSGIGRIDMYLWPYLKADLEAGRTTLDEAREDLAHFWTKGCEWIGAFDSKGSGDAQHYQNIILAGVDPQGNEATNEVTYLILDVVEELNISDFPIAVRIGAKTPERLLRRMAEVQRHGGGMVAMYNEDVVIDGLVKFGYPIEEARTFANDGCWETIIPGKTSFMYSPFDTLVLLHDTLGLINKDAPAPDYKDFDSLYAAFLDRLGKHVTGHHNMADNMWRGGPPAPLVSMFVEGCIEQGRSYYNRGSKYCIAAPHAGRLANVANSLMVLKRLVFEEQYMPLGDYITTLRNDWEGQEALRRLVQNRFTFYGNDDDEADGMMQRVFNDYAALVAQVPNREGVLRPAGISTFGREIEWSVQANNRKASADGHKEGAVLATNFSPSPGTDLEGPTAVMKSYCKMDFTRTPNGATMELKLHPESVQGDKGIDTMVAMMKTFVELGGMFLHVDVVDSAMLLDAQRHPEKYPNLAVRISGWSARFATLNKDWQDMIINRTQQYA